MDQSLDRKKLLKFDLKSLFKRNKVKTICAFTLIFIVLISLFAWHEINEKTNIMVSEKFVKAGLLLSEGKLNEATNVYEEILSYKNEFYSLLTLNIILEKNLVNDKKIILDYFDQLEKINYPENTLDLIYFKKALYLIKIKENAQGQKILKKLINKNSNLKNIAQEAIK